MGFDFTLLLRCVYIFNQRVCFWQKKTPCRGNEVARVGCGVCRSVGKRAAGEFGEMLQELAALTFCSADKFTTLLQISELGLDLEAKFAVGTTLNLFVALGDSSGVLVYPFWGTLIQVGWEEVVHLGSPREAVESLPLEVFWVWVDEAAAAPISCGWCLWLVGPQEVHSCAS